MCSKRNPAGTERPAWGRPARFSSTAVILAAALAAPRPAGGFRLVAPSTGAGYDKPANPHTKPPFEHWDLREFDGGRVPWTYLTTGTPDIDGVDGAGKPADVATANAAFTNASADWSAVFWSKVALQASGAGGNRSLSYDQFNVLFFDTASIPGDDVQAINPGNPIPPNPNAVCVTAGPRPPGLGLLETQPQGDDVVRWNAATAQYEITTGQDGTCQTTKNNMGTFGANTHAITGTFFNNRTGVLLEADIALNTAGRTWRSLAHDSSQPGAIDLQTIATHEMGHFLGIHHPAPIGNMNPPGPIMNPFFNAGTKANHELAEDDRDAIRFLYNPDLGDAPDKGAGMYPTAIHDENRKGRKLNGIDLKKPGKGAMHLLGVKTRLPGRNYTYEWLGEDVDGEFTPERKDRYDDGIKTFRVRYERPLAVKATVTVARDNAGNAHTYDNLQNRLTGMVWIDKNQNGWWQLGGGANDEEAFSAVFLPTVPANANATGTTWKTFSWPFPKYTELKHKTLPLWLRARLIWGEGFASGAGVDTSLVGARGAAQLGEVEDYPIPHEQSKQVGVRIQNGTGAFVNGAWLWFAGDVRGLQVSASRVNAVGCPLGAYPTLTLANYDSNEDETYGFVNLTSSNIPPGGWFSVAATEPTSVPLTLLRVGLGLGAQYPVPTPHCAIGVLTDSLLVSVGALDVNLGGFLDTLWDTTSGEWLDGDTVDVSYRVAPSEIPLEHLSPCDPMVSSLPLVELGERWIDPMDGFDFRIGFPGDIDVGQSLLLHVRTSWGKNGNVSEKLFQFPDPFGEALTPVAESPDAPGRALALEVFPNPFNPSTHIRFTLAEPSQVLLMIHDLSGRLVRILEDGERVAGAHEVEWDGRDGAGQPVASGLYFSRLVVGGTIEAQKLMLLR